MSTTIKHLAAQEHVHDLRREAQRPDPLRDGRHHDLIRAVQNDRDHLKVRRVAVIRSAGSHFALMPTRVSLDAIGR